MKRKYFMAVLVLLGLGVITTLAFSGGEATSTVAAPITVTQDTPAEHISDIKVFPYKGSDGMMIKLTIAAADDYTVLLQFLDDTDTVIEVSEAQSYTLEYRIAGAWVDGSSGGDSSMTYDGIQASLQFSKADMDPDPTTIYLRIYKNGSSIFANTETLVVTETVFG